MPDPVLSSVMPYGDVLAVFQDYSDYDLEPSLARAKIFIKAGRMLLAIAIRRSGQANRNEEIEVEPEIVERQVKAAVAWLATKNEHAAGPRQYVPTDWRE